MKMRVAAAALLCRKRNAMNHVMLAQAGVQRGNGIVHIEGTVTIRSRSPGIQQPHGGFGHDAQTFTPSGLPPIDRVVRKVMAVRHIG